MKLNVKNCLKVATPVCESGKGATYLMSFLLYINSILLQAKFKSISSVEQSVMVDIFYRGYKFAAILLSQDCAVHEIIAGLSNIFVVPNFVEKYKMKPSKIELILDVGGEWESIPSTHKLCDLNITEDDGSKYASFRINPCSPDSIVW